MKTAPKDSSENSPQGGDLSRLSESVDQALERLNREGPRPLQVLRGGKGGDDGSTKKRTQPTLSRMDRDMAEFPWLRFGDNKLDKFDRLEPLHYTDTIRGEGGKTVLREWTVYPPREGWGGEFTLDVMVALLDFYAEQGFQGSKIQFGTIYNILRRMGFPSKQIGGTQYARVEKALRQLAGYEFEARNAFWHAETKSYRHRSKWRLFGYIETATSGPFRERQQELPYGYIEITPTMQEIARTRGFYCLGMSLYDFYKLRPLEKRLVIYLTKRFLAEKKHQRFIEDLARAMPIDSENVAYIRDTLNRTIKSLQKRNLPWLATARVYKNTRGRWIAEFVRKAKPKQDRISGPSVRYDADHGLSALIDLLVEETGDKKAAAWFHKCARSLGDTGVWLAVGRFKEIRQAEPLANPGAMMTDCLKKVANERGTPIH